MMKTASVGTTSITNIQSYLLKTQRQEAARHQLEWESYASGEIQLSERQIGHLKDYLGQSSRGLAVDVSEDLSARNWARQMDLTRMLYQHDRPTKQGRSRSYYHFILSPDPGDDCSLATLRAYAKAWCEENLRKGDRLHEYAIVYHDDNAKGVLHAHVVANVTNKKTGRKLHLDNDQAVALEISAQSIGRRFGLTPVREEMQATVGARTAQPVYLDRKEREILDKGGYSWKWELRKFISDIAPLSNDFDDFKWKLNRAGYDVVRSEKTGYLTYTHRNGLRVRDSRLGARFYIESLEQLFNHEQVLSERSYASWELMKISKGEVPWKEDIRRAIDAVVPTVMSIPELQRELDSRYGIRLTVNRRGVTYQHACGFKTRDVGIGFRYTLEGLQQNAVVGMTLPYPGFDDIEGSSRLITRHYMPRSMRGMNKEASEVAAARIVYRDVSHLMVRYGLSRLDDIPGALEGRYEALRGAKAELVDIRATLMRWNHLSALQAKCEKDRAFLEQERETAEADLYNETLLRYEKRRLYLKEQAGCADPKVMQQQLAAAYDERLSAYQAQLNQLEQDVAIYQNYLVARTVRFADTGEGEASFEVGVERLVSANQTLVKHHIRDFYHLEKTLSDYETRSELARFRQQKAGEKKRELELIRNDIRTCEEWKALFPMAENLQQHPVSLGLEVQELRFKEAARRLVKAGVKEEDFSVYKEAYREAVRAYGEASKEYTRFSSGFLELREAQRTCQAVAESMKGSSDLAFSPSRKTSSGGEEGVCASTETRGKGEPLIQLTSPEQQADAASTVLPFEEAKRRHQERIRQAPERSRKPRVEFLR